MRFICLVTICCGWVGNLFSDDLPDPKVVTEAMRKAVTFYRSNLSVAGGYASRWPKDLSEGLSEHGASTTVIEIQPPGTPSVGLAMLKAYRAAGDPLFLRAAEEAASALMWCQLASGGWSSDFDFDIRKARAYHFRRDVLAGDTEVGKRRSISTLDDNKTQSALRFLLELANTEGVLNQVEIRKAVDFGFDGLLAAQFPNGAWPQQFSNPADQSTPVKKATIPKEWPRKWTNEKYAKFYTLNDNNMLQAIRLLLHANDLEEDPKYLESAKRAGDFLLLAQHAEPQPGWSQQYNVEMVPVWARKFEPPSLCSSESFGAITALYELWLVTGEEKYVATLPEALDWLEKSRLPNEKWARFYELGTNRPLYCEAGTYKLTYDDSDLPTHYGFQLDGDFIRKIERMRKNLPKERQVLLDSQLSPGTPEEWGKLARSLAGKTRQALKDQSKSGYWLRDDFIDSSVFVKHFESMAKYVNAAKRAAVE